MDLLRDQRGLYHKARKSANPDCIGPFIRRVQSQKQIPTPFFFRPYAASSTRDHSTSS